MSRRALDHVAVILAVAVTASLVLLIIGVVVQAWRHGITANTLSANETQVLTSAFSGIFGVLGAYVGYRAANGNGHSDPEPHRHTALPSSAWPDLGDTQEQPTVELPPHDDPPRGGKHP